MGAGITASIIGGVAAVGGLYQSYKSAGDAADAAARAGDAATAATLRQLEFSENVWETQMEEVARLEEIFGPVRENLSNYYNDMTVEQIQIRGKEQIEKQYEVTNSNIDAVFSNNGMYNSGQRASAQIALELGREEALGRNRQNAETTFNQEQMNWLAVGLQEKNVAQGLAANSAGLVNQAYSNTASTALNSGQLNANIGMTTAQGYADFGSGMLSLAGYAAGGGFNSTSLSGTSTQQVLPAPDTWSFA